MSILEAARRERPWSSSLRRRPWTTAVEDNSCSLGLDGRWDEDAGGGGLLQPVTPWPPLRSWEEVMEDDDSFEAFRLK